MEFLLVVLSLYCLQSISKAEEQVSIWGPGLKPHKIIMPARYFFIRISPDGSNNFTTSGLDVKVEGEVSNRPCRIRTDVLDRKDNSFILRYKLYETCQKIQITVKYKGQHVGQSPYNFNEIIYFDDCDCPSVDVDTFLQQWQCKDFPRQIKNDLDQFENIDWNKFRDKIIKRFDSPGAISLCHYVIKNNKLSRTCYGKYVGFKMFMDSMLLSLMRKMILPDLEFFVNLGDWPLTSEAAKYPIFSWCGSDDSFDIVMPTYDLSESTLENMGRVMLDMLSVQGNVNGKWESRIPKAFWRGRDSSRERLKLIDIAREHPDLFNVSLTNFFFFKDEQDKYGPKTDHVSFFKFFDYKYQILLDGTVAAYRCPYLFGGGSLVLKQDSKYYEHFYKDLLPNVHYIPIKRDISDLVEKLTWAIKHDDQAKIIARNSQQFAEENLLPQNIFCYYTNLLNSFSKKLKSPVEVLPGMDKVEQSHTSENCLCKLYTKDEL